jgi:hypothetical protein
MRALHLLTLASALFVPQALGACSATINTNNSPQGDDGGGNEGGSSSGGSSGSSGGSTDSGTESGPASDGPFAIANHLPFPLLVYQDGPIMTAPKVVSITFPNDPNTSTYDQLGQNIASSSYWDTVRVGYCESNGSTCIGDGPAGVSAPQTTAPAATITDAQIQTWLQTAITSNAVPAPDATMPVSNTLYVIYYPMSTVVNDGTGATSCQSFDGYHGAMTMGSQQIPYAVVDECDYGSTAATLSATTETTAHEVFEAASDPGNPAAYYLDLSDPNTYGWNDVLGGEAADLCVDIFGLGGDATTDGSITVQRIWSNAFAKAGGDPCNPLQSPDVYYNVSPSQAVYVLNVGGSVTFDAAAFSTAPTSDWSLVAQDWTDPTTQYLSFSIQGGTNTDAGPVVMVNNGSTPKITMTLLADPGPSANAEADGVLLSVRGDPNNPTADNIWPFIVITPADAMDAGLDAAVSMKPRTHLPFNHSTRRGPRAAR